jgi:hypothetical protein
MKQGETIVTLITRICAVRYGMKNQRRPRASRPPAQGEKRPHPGQAGWLHARFSSLFRCL